jgi:hypothetical protein
VAATWLDRGFRFADQMIRTITFVVHPDDTFERKESQ